MNPAQMAQQIKAELQAITWTVGAQDVVFGNVSGGGVVVFAGTPTEAQIPPGFPWCLVGIGTATMDPDHPELLTQEFSLITGVEVAGDPHGEFSIIGGSVANLGRSAGRGIAEVGERTRAAVQDLTGADGTKVLLSAASMDTPVALGRGRHMVIEELTLTALCTSQPKYAPPQELAYASGTSTWSWQGAHNSDRYDFLQYRLGWVAGSDPTVGVSPSDTTIVYTGTAASVVHDPGAVTRVYHIFADYDDRGTGTAPDAAWGGPTSNGTLVGAYYLF